jgi:hypothetical protein
MLNNDINSLPLTTGSKYGLKHVDNDYTESSKTPKDINCSMSPINSQLKQSIDFSQSLNASELKRNLMESIGGDNYL